MLPSICHHCWSSGTSLSRTYQHASLISPTIAPACWVWLLRRVCWCLNLLDSYCYRWENYCICPIRSALFKKWINADFFVVPDRSAPLKHTYPSDQILTHSISQSLGENDILYTGLCTDRIPLANTMNSNSNSNSNGWKYVGLSLKAV